MNKTNIMQTLFSRGILPWVVCGLAAAFYCYEYLLRITPGLMVPELQLAFSVKGEYLDATLVGNLSAFYYYAYTPMQLPVGVLMDRYGPRWILTMAVICCALGTAIFGITQSYWIAAFGRFAIGFGSAFAFVGVLKLASSWLPPDRFAMVSGLATTLGMIGAMIGDILLADLIQQIGWRDTILYSSYIGFILVPVIWLIVRDSPKEFFNQGVQTKRTQVSYSKLFQEIKVALKNPQIWLNGVIGGLIMAPTMVFPELWGKSYLVTVQGMNPISASHAVTMIFLGWAIGSPLAGFLSDVCKSRKVPLMLGALLTTILLFIFLRFPEWQGEIYRMNILGLFTVKLSLTYVLLFLIGVSSSAEVICFAIGRENCPSNLAGTVIAVTNFLVVSFAIFQVIVAKILDLTWSGEILDSAKIYGYDSFQTAMVILPIATGLAFLLSLFLKETKCVPYETRFKKM